MRARLALLAVLLSLQARAADPCLPVEKNFVALIERYAEAGREAITKDGYENALEIARKRALAGDKQATITMAGIPIAIRSKADQFTLLTLRQVCGFAERNNHPLHVVTCAHFNALNPLGEPAGKRAAIEREITRFAELTDPAAREPAIADAMTALEACIATIPIREPN